MLNIASLILMVVLIILATTKLKLHPFLALLLAAILAGFLGGLDSSQVLESLLKVLAVRCGALAS